MANFSKSFNFRNGVQVDNDKFIVKPVTGLVGIGNTRPSELLDVAGNIRASGIASATNIYAGVGITVGHLDSNRIMLDIDPTTGVSSITAQRFYGDGSNMSGIFAISVAGFVANDTNGGILTSFRKVGIGVTTPTDRFDVEGDSKFTGITTFVGVSTVSGDLFSTNLGVLGNSNLKGNLTVDGDVSLSGVATFTDSEDIIIQPRLVTKGFKIRKNDGSDMFQVLPNFTPATALVNGKIITKDTDVLAGLTVAGVSTFSGDVLIDGKINSDTSFRVGTALTISTVGNYIGIATFYEQVNVRIPHRNNSPPLVGFSVQNAIGQNLFAVSTVGGGGGVAAGGQFSVLGVSLLNGINAVGVSTFTKLADVNNRLDVVGGANIDQLNITGISTLTGRVNATEINSPTGSQLKILQDGIQKFTTVGAGVSVSNTLRIGSVNGGTNNLSTRHGELSYGIEGGLNSYATRRSLNLVNTDNGNINFYLDSNNIGVNTGNFLWHKSNTQLMALTNDGKLGIGITNPDTALHVPGAAKFGSDVSILNDLTVANNLTVQSGTITANVIGNVEGSVNATGVSTFSGGIEFSGDTTINAVAKISKLAVNSAGAGMGTLQPPFNTGSLEDEQIFRAVASGRDNFITAQGFIGIRTDTKFSNVILNGANANAVFGAFGVGDYEHFQSNHLQAGAVDFANAGVTTQRYMVPPKVDTTTRDALVNKPSGAFIYNTSLNKLQFWNGSAWETVTSS